MRWKWEILVSLTPTLTYRVSTIAVVVADIALVPRSLVVHIRNGPFAIRNGGSNRRRGVDLGVIGCRLFN